MVKSYPFLPGRLLMGHPALGASEAGAGVANNPAWPTRPQEDAHGGALRCPVPGEQSTGLVKIKRRPHLNRMEVFP